ncbi:glycoside hydrolase family 5 protein [Mycena rebaudengoi]|nr:glycoside hydrolase family 5 protein [Mycena rebaudengoi]
MYFAVACLCVCIFGATGVAANHTPALDTSHFVSTSRGDANFQVNGSQFRFIGTNAYWLGALNSESDLNETLSSIAAANISVVRTWAFNDVDSIPLNGTWFQLLANGTATLNMNTTTGLPKIDRMVELAQAHGIYLLFSLTNNWNPLPVDNVTDSAITSSSMLKRDVSTNNSLPRNTLSNDYGGMDAYVRAFGGSSHDDFYTNETIITAFENYTTAVVSRYVNSPSVLAWEIANDPRCNSSISATPSCNTMTITRWHARIAAHIKSIDPNHLVSSGNQGFFCPDCQKLFQVTSAPPPGPSLVPGTNSRRKNPVPLTRKRVLQEKKEARKQTRALLAKSQTSSEGVRVRGKWIATPTRRQQDVEMGSAFDGSSGVDSEDILSIPDVGFGSFQLFPDQNHYRLGDDPNLPAFNNTLQAGLDWIRLHGDTAQMFGKPITLTGFGLVTQTSSPFFVPFNSTIAPFANDQLLNISDPFGVTNEQRNDAYAQWLQQGILSGLAGMIQYQWGQGNLTTVNGTSIEPVITENGVSTVQTENGLSPDDGYSIVGIGQADVQATLQGAAQDFAPDV